MRAWLIGMSFVTGCWATTAVAGEIQAKEGLYDLTIQTTLPGMPMPAQSLRECITGADLRDPKKFMKSVGSGNDCAMQDVRQEANRLSFKLSCPREQVSGQGEYLFANDQYTGTMNMSMPNPGGPAMKTVIKTTAKWVGPCSK